MLAFLKTRPPVQGWIKSRLGLMAVLLITAGVATAQTTAGDSVTPNFRNADFVELVMTVSKSTGKSFIVDPHIHARVTMISSTAMSSAAFYEAFLSIVRVHGWATKTDGNLVTIFLDPKAVSGRRNPRRDKHAWLNEVVHCDRPSTGTLTTAARHTANT